MLRIMFAKIYRAYLLMCMNIMQTQYMPFQSGFGCHKGFLGRLGTNIYHRYRRFILKPPHCSSLSWSLWTLNFRFAGCRSCLEFHNDFTRPCGKRGGGIVWVEHLILHQVLAMRVCSQCGALDRSSSSAIWVHLVGLLQNHGDLFFHMKTASFPFRWVVATHLKEVFCCFFFSTSFAQQLGNVSPCRDDFRC